MCMCMYVIFFFFSFFLFLFFLFSCCSVEENTNREENILANELIYSKTLFFDVQILECNEIKVCFRIRGNWYLCIYL